VAAAATRHAAGSDRTIAWSTAMDALNKHLFEILQERQV